MKLLTTACLVFAVLAHLVFWVTQMFLWQTSFVQDKLFGDFMIEQKAEILAHNQGLYNGFLAIGLVWGLLAMNFKDFEISTRQIAVFFLVCALIAGVYGSVSLGRPTAFILQSIPGIIALPLIWLLGREKRKSV